MKAFRSIAAAGGLALLVGFAASPAAAQDQDRRAPVIRVYSQNGPGVASNYVTPVVQVGEDAYVFAVETDLNGQIQVLHPAEPGISVRIREQQSLQLPNFFAGFAPQYGGNSYGYADYSGYTESGFDNNDSRGTVIALASRAPFNLDRLESNGDWNVLAIQRLIERRSPFAAAQALATYLGAKGEPIGRDVFRFASLRHEYYASGSQLYDCNLFGGLYSPLYSVSPLTVLIRVAQLRRSGQNVRIAGYDYCGMPIVIFGGPRTLANGYPRPPRNPQDTGRTKGGFPRGPGFGPEASKPNQAAYGYFPITRRAQPQPGDPAVGQRRVDPREIIIDRRKDPQPTTVFGAAPPREESRPVLREAPPAPPPREVAPPRMEPTQSPPPRMEPTRSSPPPPAPAPRTMESKPLVSPPPNKS
jgi:hypothetical protein